MRLTELAPRWVAEYGDPDHVKKGVSFLCPCCKQQRLAVFFAPTICGSAAADIKQVHRNQAEVGHLADEHVGRIVWARTAGEDFDTLSLSPSIDASAWGCWHGYIANGEVQ